MLMVNDNVVCKVLCFFFGIGLVLICLFWYFRGGFFFGKVRNLVRVRFVFFIFSILDLFWYFIYLLLKFILIFLLSV